jgi:rhodanese-related sulfurtransferase
LVTEKAADGIFTQLAGGGDHSEHPDVVGIDAVLAQARAGLCRLTPYQTLAVQQQRGALVIDTRTASQRRDQGELPGALVIDRTILEWRLDPTSPSRIPEATCFDIEVVIVCREGYSSSIAAASLQTVGLVRATDMIGGVDAWRRAGLPLRHVGPVDIRR